MPTSVHLHCPVIIGVAPSHRGASGTRLTALPPSHLPPVSCLLHRGPRAILETGPNGFTPLCEPCPRGTNSSSSHGLAPAYLSSALGPCPFLLSHQLLEHAVFWLLLFFAFRYVDSLFFRSLESGGWILRFLEAVSSRSGFSPEPPSLSHHPGVQGRRKMWQISSCFCCPQVAGAMEGGPCLGWICPSPASGARSHLCGGLTSPQLEKAQPHR